MDFGHFMFIFADKLLSVPIFEAHKLKKPFFDFLEISSTS